jgi:hypothetical protein
VKCVARKHPRSLCGSVLGEFKAVGGPWSGKSGAAHSVCGYSANDAPRAGVSHASENDLKLLRAIGAEATLGGIRHERSRWRKGARACGMDEREFWMIGERARVGARALALTWRAEAAIWCVARRGAKRF